MNTASIRRSPASRRLRSRPEDHPGGGACCHKRQHTRDTPKAPGYEETLWTGGNPDGLARGDQVTAPRGQSTPPTEGSLATPLASLT